MLNFGASKPRVKGGLGPGAPLDPHLGWVCVWYPSMPCRFPGHTWGGEVEGGSGQGGCFQAHTQGEVEGDLARGVSRPTPKGEAEGIWPEGVSRPTPGGVYHSMHWGRPPDSQCCWQYSILLECILVESVIYSLSEPRKHSSRMRTVRL